MSYKDRSIDVRRIGRTHLSLYMTIPARFIKALGVAPGDYVETRLEDDSIIVKKLHTPHRSTEPDEKI